ncbi:tRNA dihydrouridine synthase [Paludibacterium yongneupense]|uniref:tRNA dihydrouridine synthase n=1 Tax=Paludibacterium yongneupense TaxID=400061 RepID=UPI00040D9113|nr:tRNA-dihydrouridine synthase [Paludibacterium yongneupense]
MDVALAPMEGLVDDIMRDILTRIGGIDLCVTEFVRVTHTLLPEKMFRRLAPELGQGSRTRAGTLLWVQLLGADPACLADNAARAASFGAAGLDLNFGCPAPTVNRHRGGAVLLDEPELLHRIVRSVRRALSSDVPLSAKMRLGLNDTSRALECAAAIEAGGAASLAVHGRTKSEGYRPPAHWDWIGRVREHVSIPVLANGDVWTLEDYRRIRAESGCDSVMIGRGLISAPDLAQRIAAWRCGQTVEPMSWQAFLPWLNEFFEQCRQRGGDTPYAAARLKQWLGLLKRQYGEAEVLFEQIRRERDATAIAAILLRMQACADPI